MILLTASLYNILLVKGSNAQAQKTSRERNQLKQEVRKHSNTNKQQANEAGNGSKPKAEMCTVAAKD